MVQNCWYTFFRSLFKRTACTILNTRNPYWTISIHTQSTAYKMCNTNKHSWTDIIQQITLLQYQSSTLISISTIQTTSVRKCGLIQNSDLKTKFGIQHLHNTAFGFLTKSILSSSELAENLRSPALELIRYLLSWSNNFNYTFLEEKEYKKETNA